MKVKLRSWWQQVRRPLGIIGIITAGISVVVLIFVVVRLYGTGFVGKTLWDWLQLLAALAIPAVVGLGAAWYTAQQGKVSDRENTDNQREAALQAYIDKMSKLLLVHHLSESKEGDEVRKIARVRTITILSQLDARRLGYVFAFLREAELMSNKPDSSVISLSEADLRKVNWGLAILNRANLSGTILIRANLSGAILERANLSFAQLDGANLSEAYLSFAQLDGAWLNRANLRRAGLWEADLSGARLSGADLSGAYLNRANLSGAQLDGANLSGANLSGAQLDGANLLGAKITKGQLKQAKSLAGATMPDGSIHA